MQQEVRLIKIIGEDNLNRLKKSKVLIVGIGGVGGITFEMLVRSSIGTIGIVDYDTFEETNLNRQILSLYSSIGKYKVESAKNRANDINNNCNIITYARNGYSVP